MNSLLAEGAPALEGVATGLVALSSATGDLQAHGFIRHRAWLLLRLAAKASGKRWLRRQIPIPHD
jgi:hypothetical protein